MKPISLRVLALLLAWLAWPGVHAEEVEPAIYECPANAAGVTDAVKAILGPRYALAADDATLEQTFRQLEVLMLQAGHCSASARSTGRDTSGREENIMEWHSMNQWLARVTNIVRLNARGDTSRAWRDEYALFAEIYEFEP